MTVTMEIYQVLIEQGDLLYKYLETILQGMIFLNSFNLLQMDRLQLTAVYCNRRGTRTDVLAVPVVTDVPVSPASVVTECWDGVSFDSDWVRLWLLSCVMFSRMAQEMEEAKSAASWTALAKEKERDWWSIDLQGEVEELEVGCPWTVTKGDSMDPVNTTPQMTCFCGAKVCTKWLQGKVMMN